MLMDSISLIGCLVAIAAIFKAAYLSFTKLPKNASRNKSLENADATLGLKAL